MELEMETEQSKEFTMSLDINPILKKIKKAETLVQRVRKAKNELSYMGIGMDINIKYNKRFDRFINRMVRDNIKMDV